jgi:hypothetical protein
MDRDQPNEQPARLSAGEGVLTDRQSVWSPQGDAACDIDAERPSNRAVAPQRFSNHAA